ncbi:MAG: adenosylmethionine decarboxylase [Arenicellales bacterium]
MSAYDSVALLDPGPHPDPGCGVIAVHWPETGSEPERQDHFVRRDGREYAGTHLIVDFWDAGGLDDLDRMEWTLREAVAAGGATLLHIHLHHFTVNGGISGVAVLAESHISVHTWPERRFAAFDVFMCGDAEPERSVAVLEQVFRPGRVETRTCLRGTVTGDD